MLVLVLVVRVVVSARTRKATQWGAGQTTNRTSRRSAQQLIALMLARSDNGLLVVTRREAVHKIGVPTTAGGGDVRWLRWLFILFSCTVDTKHSLIKKTRRAAVRSKTNRVSSNSKTWLESNSLYNRHKRWEMKVYFSRSVVGFRKNWKKI